MNHSRWIRMRRHGAVGVAALCLLLAASLVPAAPVAAADAPHVMNSATPRDGTVALELEEVWRRGGYDDEEVLLGIVTSVRTDAEGNLYVLDAQLMEVKVFSPDGELMGTLGRQGQGPGEFQNAQQMSFLPGGDAIGVAQTFPGKLVCLNLDGTPAGEITIGDPSSGGFNVLINANCGGDNLVVSGINLKFNQAEMTMDRHHFVRSYSRDGQQQAEYVTKDVHWDFGAGFVLRESESDFVWWRLTVAPDGRVLVGEPREDYVVSVYGADGALERTFGREYESWARHAELTARFESMMEAQSRQLPPGTAREVCENEQDICGLHAAADGTFWVLPSRGMYAPPEGVFAVWDVFSGEGEYLRQAAVSAPGKPGTDMLFFTDHGYAVMVTGFWDAVLAVMGAGQSDEAEPMEIVCYRIK